VLNLKLPTLGIPPREPGGGCQISNMSMTEDSKNISSPQL
jgi:hypothetical protein